MLIFIFYFFVKQLLNGIERTFASFDNDGRYPLSPLELLAMYKLLDMNNIEDRIFWVATIICLGAFSGSVT